MKTGVAVKSTRSGDLKFEFGVKVSVATTRRIKLLSACRGPGGNPFDGHTLAGALEQVTRLSGVVPDRCYVDRGYRGHRGKKTLVFISDQKRGVTPIIRKELRLRSAVEPVICRSDKFSRKIVEVRSSEIKQKILAVEFKLHI